MRTRDIKARAEELVEGYEDAYNQEFNDQFRDFIDEYMTNNGVHLVTKKPMIITEDDIQGFIDSFTFDSEEEWCYNMVQSELDDVADQRYEEEKDRRMGLD